MKDGVIHCWAERVDSGIRRCAVRTGGGTYKDTEVGGRPLLLSGGEREWKAGKGGHPSFRVHKRKHTGAGT